MRTTRAANIPIRLRAHNNGLSRGKTHLSGAYQQKTQMKPKM